MPGKESIREAEYIVERYHVAFRSELRRLQELGRACVELRLIDRGCDELCHAFDELRDALLRHMEEQELLFTAGAAAAVDHQAVRAAISRLRAALGATNPLPDCRPKALVHGLAHLVAEVEDHLDLELHFARADAPLSPRALEQGLEVGPPSPGRRT